MSTPRDNVLSLYRRKGYRFAPVAFQICPALEEKYKEAAGDTPMAEYFEYPEGFALAMVPGLHLKQREPVDWMQFYLNGVKEGTTFSPFGVAHEPGSAAAAHMTRMRHPMAGFDSLEQMQAYPFPEFETEDIEHIRMAVRAAQAQGKATLGQLECTIWETAWYIRDMTQLMMDMSEENERAVFLLDKITELATQRAVSLARAGVDIIALGDDIGMQSAIMMSREMYRTWLKPRLAKVITAAKEAKPDALIQYHTCGFVEPLIDDLIEAGVEILNPVQPECMKFADIHKKYGGRLSFNGTIGTQTTMPFGSPREVREAVFRNLEIAGPQGGLFCCPTHLLEPEVPWENVKAYVKACKDFRSAGA